MTFSRKGIEAGTITVKWTKAGGALFLVLLASSAPVIARNEAGNVTKAAIETQNAVQDVYIAGLRHDMNALSGKVDGISNTVTEIKLDVRELAAKLVPKTPPQRPR